ncbi:MAG: transglycosylase, partial [Comamonadaceae bacterium]
MNRFLWLAAIVGMLAACGSAPLQDPPAASAAASLPVSGLPADAGPLPAPILRARSRWEPVRWSELPGLEQDNLHEAWNAWVKSCERPAPPFNALCPQVRRLSLASALEQRRW